MEEDVMAWFPRFPRFPQFASGTPMSVARSTSRSISAHHSGRPMRRIVLLVLIGAGIAFGPSTSIVTAGPAFQRLTPSLSAAHGPCTDCGTGPLVPKGGPVQHHPRIFLDFWGPKWQQ